MLKSNYKADSGWNDKTELMALLIFKKLVKLGFPHGEQMRLCVEMATVTDLEKGSISAKVSNYKSVAGLNNDSNASRATKQMFAEFGRLPVEVIKSQIEFLSKGNK